MKKKWGIPHLRRSNSCIKIVTGTFFSLSALGLIRDVAKDDETTFEIIIKKGRKRSSVLDKENATKIFIPFFQALYRNAFPDRTLPTADDIYRIYRELYRYR